MSYKPGDKVQIVSQRTKSMIPDMDKYLGKVMTIQNIHEYFARGVEYEMVEDCGTWTWYDHDFERLVSSEKTETIDEQSQEPSVEDLLKQILRNQMALSRAIAHGGLFRAAISDKLIEETNGLLGEENGHD